MTELTRPIHRIAKVTKNAVVAQCGFKAGPPIGQAIAVSFSSATRPVTCPECLGARGDD